METSNTTVINNVGLALTLLMCLLMLVLSRRYVLLPVLILTCYMSMGQRVILLGLDFTMIRILIVFGWARLFLRGETGKLKYNRIDKALVWWIVSSMVLYTCLWQTTGAMINRLGHAYDALGLYFLFRHLMRNREDIDQMARMFAVCMLPLAILIVSEKFTGRNAFAIFGGVPETAVVRDGVIRCEGPFAHPILAGTFAATNMAFFAALWCRDRLDKLLALIGVLSCAAITIASGSSGPVLAYLWAVVGFCMWPLRKQMRLIRWGISLLLITLHLSMKAPVWFLIGRVGVFNGSTAFFRAYLIDSTIKNFGEWWLIGTKSTAHWGQGLFDVTNEYIAQGVDGGLLTMVLFILIISRSFGTIGRTVRKLENQPMAVKFGVWVMGGALLAHATTYISVSYFDQNNVTWFLLLATISTVGGLYSGMNRPHNVSATPVSSGFTQVPSSKLNICESVGAENPWM